MDNKTSKIPKILFLKEFDKLYSSEASNSGYQSYFLPVLVDKYENQTALLDIVKKDFENYWGFVFTSKRASQAFFKAFQSLSINLKENDPLMKICYFVVGNATSKPLQDLGLTTIGENISGDGLKLGAVIQKTKETINIGSKRLLIFTGDKNREELPIFLKANNIMFNTLKVYSTCINQNFYNDFQTLEKQFEAPLNWIVFFSPSGVDASLIFLTSYIDLKNCKIASIGNTTQKYLQDKGLSVNATALFPNPSSLLKAILEFDNDANI